MEATERGKEGGKEGGREGLPSLRVEKSSTESMNLMSAPAMKLSGLAEMMTAALTLGSLATFSCKMERRRK